MCRCHQGAPLSPPLWQRQRSFARMLPASPHVGWSNPRIELHTACIVQTLLLRLGVIRQADDLKQRLTMSSYHGKGHSKYENPFSNTEVKIPHFQCTQLKLHLCTKSLCCVEESGFINGTECKYFLSLFKLISHSSQGFFFFFLFGPV